MTLHEILQDVTILANNCTYPTTSAWVSICFGGMLIIIAMACLIHAISFRDPVPKILIGTTMVFAIIFIIISIVVLGNEQMALRYTNVSLYVCFNGANIEDVAKYFRIENVATISDHIYADITPITEYSMDIKNILHSMGII